MQGVNMSGKSGRRALSLGEAIQWLLDGISSDNLAPIRFYLEAYHGKELDFADPFLLDLLNVEFGLSRAQAGELTPPQLGFLLRHKHHLKNAPTQEDRERVLREVADVRHKIGPLADPDRVGTEAFLAALSTFPPPRAVSRQSAPEIPENLDEAESRKIVDAVEKLKRPTGGRSGSPVPEGRLRAVLDATAPYLILDGTPFPAEEVAVHYLDALIKANGRRVSFAEWVQQNPRFEGAIVTRVLDRLPQEIQRLIERGGKGSPPRLKVELLRSAQ
jgi:hypothetical protein